MKVKEKPSVEASNCNDVDCPIHGKLRVRGRIFKGYVVKKFPRRIVVEFERIIYVRKYERYTKKKTRMHARLPKCKENEVAIGDYVLIQECRPLSKIIHFAYLRKVKSEENLEKGKNGK